MNKSLLRLLKGMHFYFYSPNSTNHAALRLLSVFLPSEVSSRRAESPLVDKRVTSWPWKRAVCLNCPHNEAYRRVLDIDRLQGPLFEVLFSFISCNPFFPRSRELLWGPAKNKAGDLEFRDTSE